MPVTEMLRLTEGRWRRVSRSPEYEHLQRVLCAVLPRKCSWCCVMASDVRVRVAIMYFVSPVYAVRFVSLAVPIGSCADGLLMVVF